jgi:hypothetical protein
LAIHNAAGTTSMTIAVSAIRNPAAPRLRGLLSMCISFTVKLRGVAIT